MLKALVEGNRDAGWMADYVRGTLRNKKRELESALDGTFTTEQRWLLGRELRQRECLQQQLAAMEAEIEQRIAAFSEELRRLITIPGVDRITAWTIVAEVGVDMKAFEDARHLASWAGLLSGQSRKWWQADEWPDAQGQLLCETRSLSGCVGCFAHPE